MKIKILISLLVLLCAVLADNTCVSYEQKCQFDSGKYASKAGVDSIDILKGQKHYYWFTFAKPADEEKISIALTVLAGDPDLFITWDGTEPSAIHWDRCSQKMGDKDIIIIDSSELPDGQVTINIMINSQLEGSAYRLTGRVGEEAITLEDGKPQRDEITIDAGGDIEYKYYTITADAAHASKDFTVQVTGVTGDPDLVISRTVAHPTKKAGEHDVMSTHFGGDSITINHTDITAGDKFHIGVFSMSDNVVVFTVVASFDHNYLLLDGVPQEFEGITGADKYFSFYVEGTPEISIQVTPDKDGDVQLFASAQARGEDYVKPDADSPWKSDTHLFDTEIITIKSDDAHYPATNAQFNVLVHVGVATRFTILATTSSQAISLQSGVSRIATTETGKYSYFSAEPNMHLVDLIIDVTPLNGRPDVFVGCTLDVTGTEEGYPSAKADHHKWTVADDDAYLVRIDDQDADFCVGAFYIAILAKDEPATYSVSFRSQNQPQVLRDGETTLGEVGNGVLNYYRFYVEDPEKSGDVTVSLTPFDNRADIYVTFNGDLPSVDHKDIFHKGVEMVDTFVISKDKLTAGEYINAMVMASEDTKPCMYGISMLDEGNIQMLIDSAPMIDAVGGGAYKFYSFFIPYADMTFTATVTPFAGDSDLYVSNVDTKPTARGYAEHPENYHISIHLHHTLDQVVIKNADVGFYYIGVTGYEPSEYSIVASAVRAGAEGMTTITDGTPASGEVDLDGFTYFQLNVGNFKATWTFDVSPVKGDMTLYINKCEQRSDLCDGSNGGTDVRPNKDNFHDATWSSDNSPMYHTVQIAFDDAKACSDCSYIIAIHGNTENAVFSLQAFSDDSTTRLIEGVPVRDSIKENAPQYYMFSVNDAHKDITISVTPISGDPDLFVDLAPNYKPDKDNKKWRSSSFGGDVVVIQAGVDPNYQLGDYYIGVHSSDDADYTVMATLSSDLPTLMIEGIPQSSSVKKDTFAYFGIHLDGATDVTDLEVILTPTMGDADLYANTDGSKPNTKDKDYYSLHSAGEDRIFMKATDAKFKTNCVDTAGCHIIVAVYGIDDSDFDITWAHTSTAITLMNNQPQQGIASPTTPKYYEFPIREKQDVHVVVTPKSGDPELFISTTEHHPTATKSDWSTMSFSVEEIIIKKEDTKFCEPPCTFYIAVIDAENDHDATFDIVASMGETGITKLMNGGTITKTVAPEAFSYFSFVVPTGSGVDFTLQPNKGAVSMYVNAGENPAKPIMDGTTFKNYFWNAVSSASAEHIQITPTSEHYVSGEDNLYVIGVYGAHCTDDCEFSITAVTDSGMMALRDGEPHEDHIAREADQSYRVDIVQQNTDVYLVYNAFFGDVEVYISETPNPTRATAKWVLNQWKPHITVQAGQITTPQPGVPSQLFLTVHALDESRYSIVSTMSQSYNSPLTLKDGMPVSGSVDLDKFQYYRFHLTSEIVKKPLTIRVMPEFGDTDVYVAVYDPKDPRPAGPGHASHQAVSFMGAEEITIKPGEDDYHENTYLDISIHGAEFSDYSVIVTTEAMFANLQSGIPMTGNKDNTKFAIDLNNEDAKLTVATTVTSGVITLFVDVVEDLTPSTAHWRRTSYSTSPIVIDKNDIKFCFNCRYYILAQCVGDEECAFTITATVNVKQIINLNIGRSESASIDENEIVYFQIQLPSTAQDLSVESTVREGTPHFYLTDNPAVLPDPKDVTTYQKDSLEGFQLENPLTSTTFVVAAQAEGNSASFDLIAYSAEQIIPLNEGQPATHTVGEGEMVYFSFLGTQLSHHDISISVMPLTGDPDIVVSSQHKKPYCEKNAEDDENAPFTCHDYTWNNSGMYEETLTISHEDPCANTPASVGCDAKVDWRDGMFYIGVFGYSASKFTITATNIDDLIKLPLGLPQSASTQLKTVCPERNEHMSCIGNEDEWKHRQVSYFSVFLAEQNAVDDELVPSHLQLLFDRSCTGDKCKAFSIYVSSCHSDEADCPGDRRYPASWTTAKDYVNVAADRTRAMMYITSQSKGFCDDTKHACIYFISVIGADDYSVVNQQFRVQVNSDNNIQIINPPADKTKRVVFPVRNLDSGVDDTYQAFVDQGDDLQVTIEPCTGNPAVYICDGTCTDVLPSSHDFRYSADARQTCTKKAGQDPVCQVKKTPTPGEVVLRSTTRDNYFMRVFHDEDKTSSYRMSFGLSDDALTLTPKDGSINADVIAAKSITVTWDPVTWQHVDGSKVAVPGSDVTYKIYMWKQSDVDTSFVPFTSCGILMLDNDKVTTAVVKGDGTLSAKLTTEPSTKYTVNVIAIANDQDVAYLPYDFGTPEKKGNGGGMGMTLVIILLFLLIGAGVAVVIFYRRNIGLQQRLQYEINDVRNVAATIGTTSGNAIPGASGGMKKGYAPLLGENDDELMMGLDQV